MCRGHGLKCPPDKKDPFSSADSAGHKDCLLCDYPFGIPAYSCGAHCFSPASLRPLLCSVPLLSFLYVCPFLGAWLGPVCVERFYPGCWPDRGRGSADGFLGNPYLLGHQYDAARYSDNNQVKSHVLHSSGLPGFLYLFLSFLELSIHDSVFLDRYDNPVCGRRSDLSEIKTAICRCVVGPKRKRNRCLTFIFSNKTLAPKLFLGFRCQKIKERENRIEERENRIEELGVRCQWQSFRINDTVNSRLVANKFFVFILNHTPHTLRVTVMGCNLDVGAVSTAICCGKSPTNVNSSIYIRG